MTRCTITVLRSSRLDDKLAALDNHAARRMHISEWQHLRTLAAAEGDSVIVAECDYRIAKLTARVDIDALDRSGCARRMDDRDKLIATLVSKLAEAKRLGLEACALVHGAIDNAPDPTSNDPGDQSTIVAGHSIADRIAAALEAL